MHASCSFQTGISAKNSHTRKQLGCNSLVLHSTLKLTNLCIDSCDEFSLCAVFACTFFVRILTSGNLALCSCIPLYNFVFVYDYVMSSHKSFVDSFFDHNDTQYNSKMSSVIPKSAWRKGSQWFVLIRKHAEAVIADSSVFPVFQDHCKKVILPEVWTDDTVVNKTQDNCIPDEHYIQTLLAVSLLSFTATSSLEQSMRFVHVAGFLQNSVAFRKCFIKLSLQLCQNM
jgi:hypothetical protein